MVGNASATRIVLTSMNNEKISDLPKALDLNSKTCKSDYRSPLVNRLDIECIGEKSRSNNSLFKQVVKEAVNKYQSDVIKCWWQEKEIKIGSAFVNRIIDDNFCYTFNAGNEFIRFLESLEGNELNMSNYDEDLFISKNSKTSNVRMLININQTEYCGTRLIKRGAGLFAMLTEKDNTPLQIFDTPIYLSPEYVHNVIVRPIIYKRYTDHLGYCANKVDLFLFPTGKKYLQGVCHLQCIIATFLRKCKCFPMYLLVYQERFLNLSKTFEVPGSAIKICRSVETDICQENIRERLNEDPIIKMCSSCKRPCFQTIYEFKTAQSLMNVKEIKHDLNSVIGIQIYNESVLRKNFFYVSFSFQSSYAEVVEERQAIGLDDLFISYGGNIGLFLGMSFMSVFEIILHFIFQSCVVVAMKLMRIFKTFLFDKSLLKNSSTKKYKKRRVKRRKPNSVCLVF